MKKSTLSMIFFLILFNCLCSFGADNAAASRKDSIASKNNGIISPKSAEGFITMNFDLSNYPANRDVKLWIPYPVSSEYQTISDIKVKGNYNDSGVYTDKKFHNNILYARWKPGVKTRKLTFQFYARRIEVVRRDFPTDKTCWNPADYKMWLEPTSMEPINGPVKKLARKITKGKTDILSKAKAIYNWTCTNMYRDPNTIGCGKGDVLKLLKKPGGKCTDIHSVFVALCRAAGVPAREIFGIRMGKKQIVDVTKWEHCWAEFYLPGYGWVPVDPADVRKKMLKNHLSLKDKETKKWRKYFWGAWDPFRIRLSMGRDIKLNPPQTGQPLNNFGYPYAEINGNAPDWYAPATFKYKIIFHKQQ